MKVIVTKVCKIFCLGGHATDLKAVSFAKSLCKVF
jgi:hypothetical protein